MQKDLKIGLLSGLVLVSVAVVWLATRPSLTPQARLSSEADPALVDKRASDETQVTIEKSARRVPSVRRTSSVAREPTSGAVAGEAVDGRRPAKSAVQVQPETIKAIRTHVVRDGETLSEISYAYYGSATKWKRIFEANRRTIRNPNVVMPGAELIIPE